MKNFGIWSRGSSSKNHENSRNDLNHISYETERDYEIDGLDIMDIL